MPRRDLCRVGCAALDASRLNEWIARMRARSAMRASQVAAGPGRAGILLQAVNIIRLSGTDVLGVKLAHDIGDLATIVDAETEQRAARKRETL